MEHHAFQCAPQSVSTTQPNVLQANKSQAQFHQRQKRPRKSARQHVATAPSPSASASRSVAPDPDEEVQDMTSESDTDEVQPSPRLYAGEPRQAEKPARKRRHLGSEEVGRFASLSIDQRLSTFTSSDVTSPPLAPQAPPTSPLPATTALQEISATSVEEPDDDDVAMRARRGPSTYEMQKNRFFVSSLSDDSSDEEAQVVKKSEDRIDTALSSGPLESQSDGGFLVNGELISRLQAIESQRRMALGRDRALLRRRNRARHSDESGSSTPIPGPPTSLVLWRKPDDLSLKFAERAPTPLVVEEGDYAYVQRPPSLASSSLVPSHPRDDAMDIDG